MSVKRCPLHEVGMPDDYLYYVCDDCTLHDVVEPEGYGLPCHLPLGHDGDHDVTEPVIDSKGYKPLPDVDWKDLLAEELPF